MSKKQITKEKIIHSFLSSAAEKSPGAASLADISEILEIKKASLYNHFSSRDDMYNSTLEYCAEEIHNSTFITETNIEAAKNGKIGFVPLLKKIITQYFKLFECEPFFKMYVFVHSEQYFNRRAMEILLVDYKRLGDELKRLLKAFSDSKKVDISEKQIKEIPQILIALMIHQLDVYIAQKKETIRQNPDTGVGSLFALPTDTVLLNKCLKPIETYLENLL